MRVDSRICIGSFPKDVTLQYFTCEVGSESPLTMASKHAS